jgi:prevent-host-death family protein
MAMESVSVATLKSNLSRYLAAVKKGKEVMITSHQHPIARLLPVERAMADDLKIIPAKKPVSSLKKIKGINLKFDLVADLLADRRRR